MFLAALYSVTKPKATAAGEGTRAKFLLREHPRESRLARRDGAGVCSAPQIWALSSSVLKRIAGGLGWIRWTTISTEQFLISKSGAHLSRSRR